MKLKISDIIGIILIIGTILFGLLELYNYIPEIIEAFVESETNNGEGILSPRRRGLETIHILEIAISAITILGLILLTKRNIQKKKKPGLLLIGILGLLASMLIGKVSFLADDYYSTVGATSVIYYEYI